MGKKVSPNQKDEGKRTVEISLDMEEYYQVKQKELSLDISRIRYSNHQIVQSGNSDIYVDFLEMPGIRKDEKWVIEGTRIYLPPKIAKGLARALLRAVNDVIEELNISEAAEETEDVEEENLPVD